MLTAIVLAVATLTAIALTLIQMGAAFGSPEGNALDAVPGILMSAAAAAGGTLLLLAIGAYHLAALVF